ncbi:MAG: U32 family peptidase [Muribaculaceae bacterium]
MLNDNRIKVELLAPARTADIGIQAIIHGADAVYIGASSFGARSAAGNSIEDIERLVKFAHQFYAKVYVTINTIIYDDELQDVQDLIRQLYKIGVDALIVQDMALLEMKLPPIPLHASTQCDIRDVEKAKFLSSVGFSQLVLARELSLKEIRNIHSAVNTPLEVFIHGALCVCYSGDCQAGYAAMGRSANRGECPQICRLPFDLIDGTGKTVISQKHLLSLKDMNRFDYLEELLDAGVTSFKIEGRLKDEIYVKNVVSAYRKELDGIIAKHADKYVRSSIGITEYYFQPHLSVSFNRGYTDYFLKDQRPLNMSSLNTPKSIGLPIAKVLSCENNVLHISSKCEINNGDGLGYFNNSGVFTGFRVNKVVGDKLYLRNAISICKGTVLYRNKDVKSESELSKQTAARYIPISFVLKKCGENKIALDAFFNDKIASSAIEYPYEKAKSPQLDARKRVLSKLGDTIFKPENIEDRVGDAFIPASILTQLRRQTISALETSMSASYPYEYRKDVDKCIPVNRNITRHDNVANKLSEEFYMKHGATSIESALEVSENRQDEIQVMTTRYCLRRELGACMRTPDSQKFVSPLTLKSGNLLYRLDFDCKNCRMKVFQIRHN